MMHASPDRTAPVTLAVLLLLGACGGGGGGDAALPTATVSFPSSGVLTDAASITVSGETEPGGSAVLAVRVAGVAATSADGFATWSAAVPLSAGDNALEVELEDADGTARVVAEVLVRRDALIEMLSGVDVDPDRQVAWITDFDTRALLVADLVDGSKQLVSGDGVGAGPLLVRPIDVVALDGNTVYVLDTGLDGIVEVQVKNGDRRVLPLAGDALQVDTSAGGLEVGPTPGTLLAAVRNGVFLIDLVQETSKRLHEPASFLVAPRDVAVDETSGDVLVLFLRSVERLDLATGALTPVSDESGTGKGDDFSAPAGLDVDPKTGELWVANALSRTVLVIEPSSGERKAVGVLFPDSFAVGLAFDPVTGGVLIADGARGILHRIDPQTLEARELFGGVGVGPAFIGLDDAEVADGRLFGLDDAKHFLVELDLATGDRKQVSGAGVGQGDELEDLGGLALDLEGMRAFVSDLFAQQVYEIDLSDGDRDTFAVGGAPTAFASPDDLARLPDGRLLILDRVRAGIFVRDPETGVQTALSVNGDGRGGDFLPELQNMVVDLARNRLLVADIDPVGATSIKAVDLDSGIRSTVDTEVGGERWSALALDAPNGRLFVGDNEEGEVLAVDLEGGGRTLVSGPTVGGGPSLRFLTTLAFDPQSGRLFTHSRFYGAVLAVSPESGDRVIFSK